MLVSNWPWRCHLCTLCYFQYYILHTIYYCPICHLTPHLCRQTEKLKSFSGAIIRNIFSLYNHSIITHANHDMPLVYNSIILSFYARLGFLDLYFLTCHDPALGGWMDVDSENFIHPQTEFSFYSSPALYILAQVARCRVPNCRSDIKNNKTTEEK